MTAKSREAAKKAKSRSRKPLIKPAAEENSQLKSRANSETKPTANTAAPVEAESLIETTMPNGPEWLPLVPSGVMILPGDARPVFLLKHEASGETLPVWMGPLDASVALQELGQGGQGSPHALTKQILTQLGITVGRCYFVERIGHHQFVHIHLATATGIELPGSPFRVRADEAISFSLAMKVHFFSTKEFIAQCRVLNQELEKLQEGLLTGIAGEAFPELEIGSKKPGYMM